MPETSTYPCPIECKKHEKELKDKIALKHAEETEQWRVVGKLRYNYYSLHLAYKRTLLIYQAELEIDFENSIKKMMNYTRVFGVAIQKLRNKIEVEEAKAKN